MNREKKQLFILTFLKKANKEKSEKMKILGIDDNEDLLNLCEITLTSDGHEFTGITNGRDGLKAIRDEKFDAVLLDLSMPDFSGVDVIDALVKEDIMKKQKVVIFTGTSPTEKEIDRFLEKGVHSVLKQPVDADFLSEFFCKLEAEI